MYNNVHAWMTGMQNRLLIRKSIHGYSYTYRSFNCIYMHVAMLKKLGMDDSQLCSTGPCS